MTPSLRPCLQGAFMAMLLAALLWVWSTGIDGPYLFDDFVTPLNDPASQSLDAWRQNLSVTLRPVTKLTYAAEVDSGIAVDPSLRRIVSLLLLAAAAVALGVLTFRLTSIGAYGSALLAALWFAHPVHADAVLLLSGRSAMVSVAFLLAALLALERSHRWTAALLFGLACLSRETALAGLMPLVVLAMSGPHNSAAKAWREIAPTLLIAVFVACWMFSTQRYADLAEYSLLGRPLWSSFISQVSAVPVGLGLLLQPSNLSIDYGIPLATRLSAPTFVLGVLLYAAAAVGIVLALTRSRAIAVGLALWLAALLPTQSFVPKLDALTNRPLSLALAGLLLAAAPLIVAASNRLRTSYRERTPLIPLAALTCGGLLFVATAVMTLHRAQLFRSDLALWQDAAMKSSANVRPHLQYAALLKRIGRDHEAWRVAATAQRIDPLNSQAATMARLFRTGDITQ